MASVTLEVKINNQSCKQRKRRGRSWGKQVTNGKHIGASQVKQKRETDRWAQAEVLVRGVIHSLFSRTAHWERAQKDCSTCSGMARSGLFWTFYFWAISPFPTCTHHLLVKGKDSQWHWSIPGRWCWGVCLAKLCCSGANSSSPQTLIPSASKPSQLTDLVRVKFYPRDILGLGDEIPLPYVHGEPGQVPSCVSPIQKKSFPPQKNVPEKTNFASKCSCFSS